MKKLLFICCCTLLLFTNCNKNSTDDESIINNHQEECIPIPPPVGITTPWGHEWTTALPNYEFPRFNPNNPDELIFRFQEHSTDTIFQLVKYNLVTQERETIFEGFLAIPKWSRKDWILFHQNDFNLYKIKSNGDSLTQLTFSENCQGAEWNKEGDKFIYQSIGLNDFIICDEVGNPLDTIDGVSLYPSWQHDSLLANVSTGVIFIQNPNSEELDFKIIHEVGTGGTTIVHWLDSDNIIWASNDGIFKTNIITEETILLIESCDAKVYKYPTVSNISNKIVFQRTDKELIETEVNKGIATSRIFMMDFDGTNIEEILLPQ